MPRFRVAGRAWAMTVSMATMLVPWASSLRDVKARVAASAGLFLGGLPGPERREAGWRRAEADDPGPRRQQAILGRKQGKSSRGVGRQCTGSAGKITNCPVGVFAACWPGAAWPMARAFFATWRRREAIPRSDVSEADRAGAGIGALVAVEGRRWAVGDSFEAAQAEFGLDHNSITTRADPGTAGAAMPRWACWRPFAAPRTGQPLGDGAAPDARPARLVRWSLQDIRRVATRLAQRRIHPAHLIAGPARPRAHQPTRNAHT